VRAWEAAFHTHLSSDGDHSAVAVEADAALFSSNGRVSLRKETVAALVDEIRKEMQVAGELERGSFSMRDLRRTAETHMAALGISSDVRAQIQSHGLGGIQVRHYDRHDYMVERRVALTLWVQRFRNIPTPKGS
jgi:integrase